MRTSLIVIVVIVAFVVSLLCALGGGVSDAYASGRNCRAIKRTLRLARRHSLRLRGLRKLKRLYCSGQLRSRRRSASVVLFSNTDHCSGTPLAHVGPRTDCLSLDRKSKTWSIKVGGVCYNTQDTTLQKACYRFRDAVLRDSLKVYRSDSCGAPMSAWIAPQTDCRFLDRTRDAWAIRVKGRCQNIADMSLQQACSNYSAAQGRAFEVFDNDSCVGTYHTIVGAMTSCHLLSSKTKAQSIRIGKRCLNVKDTSTAMVCHRFQALLQSRHVKIYKSDSCNGSDDLLAAVGPDTNCGIFRSKKRHAWAIKSGGQCLNITDTTLERACAQYQYK